MIVEFINVGREKLCWEESVGNLTTETLLRCVKRRHALMSNDIDFSDCGDTPGGEIIVGGFRTVGMWRVKP